MKPFTPNLSAPSMCVTCRYATQLKGRKLQEDYTHCAQMNEQIRFVVTECSTYEDKRLPSLHEMHKIAWRISADKAARHIGFSPEQHRQMVKDGKVDDDDDLLYR